MNGMAAASDSLDDYEQRVLDELLRWEQAPPPFLARGFARLSNPATRALQLLVPVGAIRMSLETANAVAARLADERSVLELAGATELGDLRAAGLARCDALAAEVRFKAMGLAAGGGALTGVAGAPGLMLDVPALLTLALRTIHRTGLCYGYRLDEPGQRPYAIGVFSLASANSMDEKKEALLALRHAGRAPDVAAWRDGLERAAQRELSKSAAVFSLQNLAHRLGLNLGRRKAAATIPILGAAVSAVVNAWYLNELATTARFAFQSRRLMDGGHLG
jgi:hypothetical protein